MGTIKPRALLLCAVHQKTWYATKGLAEAAMRRLPNGTGDVMSAYPCEAASADDFWHYGTDRDLVTAANVKRGLVYSTASVPEGLTHTPFAVLPINGEPINGTPAIDVSIEALLSAAESSGVQAAQDLATQIRGLVAELVREVRIGEQERELEARKAALQAQLDQTIAQLHELRGEPEAPANYRAANLPPSGDQAAIRAWAREQTNKGVKGLEVKPLGSIPKHVREAYDKATGGA